MSSSLTITRRSNGIHCREIMGEIVVYDSTRTRFYSLNAISAKIWEWSESEASFEKLQQKLANDQGCTLEESGIQLAMGIRRLERAGLIEVKNDVDYLPESFSRRRALNLIRNGLSLPLISTITLSAPVGAVSTCGFCNCGAAGHPCSTTQGGTHRACFDGLTCHCRHFGCLPNELQCGIC